MSSPELSLSVTDGEATDTRRIVVEVRFVDEDVDGVPDTWEAENGFDPTMPDSDGDGVSDADEACPQLSGRGAECSDTIQPHSKLWVWECVGPDEFRELVGVGFRGDLASTARSMVRGEELA